MSDESLYIESIVENCDWVMYSGYSFLDKAISGACKSKTFHGGPIYFDQKDKKWWTLDARPIRLDIASMEQLLKPALKKKENFIICRQNILNPIDMTKFQETNYPFLSNLRTIRPYYNIFDYPALIYYSLQLDKYQAELSRLDKLLSTTKTNTASIVDEIVKITKLIESAKLRLKNNTYCTQILYNMWTNQYKKNIIKERYGIEFCRPKEQELLLKDGVYKYVYGYYDGVPSDKLYQEIMNS